MKTYTLALTTITGLAIGCAADSKGGAGGEGGIDSAGNTMSGTGTTGGSAEAEGPGNGPGDGTSNDDGNVTDGEPAWDVGAGGANYCMDREAGIYCNSDNHAIECDDEGNEVTNVRCTPDECLDGIGCVECLAGRYDCKGDAVYSCNDAADPPVWEQIEVCDPSAGEGCDLALGACVPLQIVGGTEPTGEYYQFAYFPNGDVFLGGYDVDGIDDKLYVERYGAGIDVYTLELLDSDGDGRLEPNQHPDSPDEPGPIEERVLTFIETIDYPGTITPGASEAYISDDRLFVGGAEITEYVYATEALTTLTTVPSWAGRFSVVGYDDVNGDWYAGLDSTNRRVYQYCAETDTWGIAFRYPDLAGSHMDGLEVVTDPETGIPYVYVSDMTSDFIGQYEKHPTMGWVQKNLFSYQGTSGELLEGMGFGPLYHFWATSGSSLYEVGGGDVADFVEPPG
jgi:hypothetical protein